MPSACDAAGNRNLRRAGMGFGLFILGVGALLTLFGSLIALVQLLAIPERDPKSAGIWGLAAFGIVVGVPLVFYGKSLFHRARTDRELISDQGFGKPGRHRGLAWTAAVLSSLLLVGATVAYFTAARREFLAVHALFGPMLAAAIRHLRERPPSESDRATEM